MTVKRWLFILIIIGLVAVTIVIVAYLLLGPQPEYFYSLVGVKKNYSLPTATGNIDDSVSALLKEAGFEESIAAEEDADLEMIKDDTKEVGGFGQSVNENEF